MAESGRNQWQIFNFPISVRIDNNTLLESTVQEGDRHYGNQTNITGSNIDTVVAGAGQPGPADFQIRPDNAQLDHGNNQANLDDAHPDPEAVQPDFEGLQSDNGSEQPNQTVNPDTDKVAEDMQPTILAANRPTVSRDISLKRKGSLDGSGSKVGQPNVSKIRRSQISSTSCRVPETLQERFKTASTDSEQRLNIAYLKERCSSYLWISEPDYLTASELLEELAGLQQESEFDTMLQLAECYLHLGKEEEAEEAIGEVKSMIMEPQPLSAIDIQNLANELAESSAFTRAIILLPIACKKFNKEALPPNDAVNNMAECIEQMCESVEALLKEDDDRSFTVGVEFGIDCMEQMYENLSSIEGADCGLKILKRASALHWIGHSYVNAGKFDEGFKWCDIGIKLLEQEFHGDQSKYSMYATLLYNSGEALFGLSKLADAKIHYKKSKKACKKATDYEDNEAKRDAIEKVRKGIKETNAMIGKK